MKHINALREENDGKMREIFDKFEIVQEKLCEFESDGGDKFGSPKDDGASEGVASEEDAFGKSDPSVGQVQEANMPYSSSAVSQRESEGMVKRGFTSVTGSRGSKMEVDHKGARRLDKTGQKTNSSQMSHRSGFKALAKSVEKRPNKLN